MLKLRLKIALLLMLMGSAAFTGAEALRSLRTAPGTGVPEELYRHYKYIISTALALSDQGFKHFFWFFPKNGCYLLSC